MLKPNLVIKTRDNGIYLERWWLIPRNRYFNIYLHRISDSDDDRALHDHPWYNVSIILKGHYDELTLSDNAKKMFYHLRAIGKLREKTLPDFVKPQEVNAYGLKVVKKRRNFLSVVFRRPWTPHRLIVDKSKAPVWTLFITGPVIRTWGFHMRDGWIKHSLAVYENDPGKLRDDLE